MYDRALNQIIIVTMLMMIGVLLRKKKIATDEVLRGLSEILINVTLPCAILVSFNMTFSMKVLDTALMTIAASTVIHAIATAVSHVLYGREKAGRRPVLQFLAAYPNCGFVGIPLMQGIFGPIGVFYASIFIIPNTIFTFTYGIIIFSGKTNIKSLMTNLLNLPFIFTIIGACMFLTSVSLPGPVLDMASLVGDMTAPIAMFVVGAMLADVRLREIFRGLDVYGLGLLKLIVFPALSYLALSHTAIDQTVMYVCVLLTAMPSAAMGAIFSQRYGCDNALASKAIFITTVLSMGTLPAIVWLIH